MTWNEAINQSLADVQASGIMDEMRGYLKIDGNDDDAILFQCVKASIDYIVNAVGEFDEDSPKAVLLMYAITQDFYDNRQLMQSEIQQKMKQRESFRSVILQLQLAKAEKDDAS